MTWACSQTTCTLCQSRSNLNIPAKALLRMHAYSAAVELISVFVHAQFGIPPITDTIGRQQPHSLH